MIGPALVGGVDGGRSRRGFYGGCFQSINHYNCGHVTKKTEGTVVTLNSVGLAL